MRCSSRPRSAPPCPSSAASSSPVAGSCSRLGTTTGSPWVARRRSTITGRCSPAPVQSARLRRDGRLLRAAEADDGGSARSGGRVGGRERRRPPRRLAPTRRGGRHVRCDVPPRLRRCRGFRSSRAHRAARAGDAPSRIRRRYRWLVESVSSARGGGGRCARRYRVVVRVAVGANQVQVHDICFRTYARRYSCQS
jgi:hypothetical protein